MTLTRPKYSSIIDTDFKINCKAATVGVNITLSGSAPNTLDGISLQAGDRVLVKDQSTASQNGVYVVTTLGTGSNGTWTRARDFNDSAVVTSGIVVPVSQGALAGGRLYLLTTPDPITLGTTGLTFIDTTSAGSTPQNFVGATGNVTLNQFNDTVISTATSNITVTLPSAAVLNSYYFANNSDYTMTIQTTGGQLINDSTSLVLQFRNSSVRLISNGTKFFIF